MTTSDVDAILSVPPSVRWRLVAALDAGRLSPPFSPASVRASVGTGAVERVVAAGAAFTDLGIGAAGAAAWLRSLDIADRPSPTTDLVWSGPRIAGLQARSTRRVFEDLVAAAERSVWVSTYAYFDGPRAFEVLAQAMDRRPALHVNLVLNVARPRGDDRSAEALAALFAQRLWSNDWPGERCPAVFYDPRSLGLNRAVAGVVHAKALVVDERHALVTSANLTEAAFDRNVELGVLVDDRIVALGIVRHLDALINQLLLVPLPSRP